MSQPAFPSIVESLARPNDRLRRDVLHGLSLRHKTLPCKYFYDERGSSLFEQICRLDEYYPTRTEFSIMKRHASEISEVLGPNCLLIEPGAGNGEKTRILLQHLHEPAGYVPIDISGKQLLRTVHRLRAQFPALEILPVHADFMAPIVLPRVSNREARGVVYFPGSTIGNFSSDEAIGFLIWLAALCGKEGALLIGVDLKKDPAVLLRAYDDAAGVTARFNLNLLVRLNRELGANFQIDRFRHCAFYHASLGRIEMYLVSLTRQTVRIGNIEFLFERGETIHTENCYKFDLTDFRDLAACAGFEVRQVWMDDRRFFSVQYLVRNGTPAEL
jgi:dimethylhistidine N-methyltransferase